MAHHLADKGYEVTYICVPISDIGGEFDLYKLESGVKTAIFSNNSKLHGDAVIGDTINKNNVEEILKKLDC